MDLWDKALQNLDPTSRQLFQVDEGDPQEIIQRVLKDVQGKRDTAREKRWRFTKKNGSAVILRDVFEKIVHSISKYAQVMDVVVNTAPMYAAPPWAAVRFLLQVSTSDLGAFSCVSDGLEIVTDVMARYELIEQLYLHPTAVSSSLDLQHLSGCVLKVYTIILRYLAKARKFWSENTAKRMAKALLNNMEAEHRSLQSAITTSDDETYRTITLLGNQQSIDVSNAVQKALLSLQEETTMPLIRIAQNIADMNDKLDSNQRREVLHWLSTVPCESQHREAARKIVPGTGQWLLNYAELLEWQRSSSSAIFWLHGIPGAGKSKLTSIVIESLTEQHKNLSTQPPPLAYFYCSRKGADPRSKDPSEILSALLRQLTGQDTQASLRGSVAPEYQRRKEHSDETGAQISRLDMEEVVTQILNITAVDPVILVIDALDEVDENGRGDLFRSLERVVQESENVVKIFVSSRDDGDIVDSFEQHANISMDEGMNGEDIKSFVEFKVQEVIEKRRLLRGRVSSSLKSEFIETLTRRAQGMFRWVELSIETLSNSRRMAVEKDVRSELGKLPAGLKEQYELIYKDVLESAISTASIARKTFSWMLAAQRVLTVAETIAAVALDDDGDYQADLDVPLLLDICRNLLTVTSINGTSGEKAFQMAHLSVREFLEQLPEFSAEQIHTDAVSRLLDNFDSNAWLEKDLSIRENHRQILRKYSVYLFEHAEMSRLAKTECDVAYKMKAFLFDDRYKPTQMLHEWQYVVNEIREGCLLLQNHPDMPLYDGRVEYDGIAGPEGIELICMYGLLSILGIIGQDEKISCRERTSDHFPEAALLVAAEYRKSAVVKWLLENQIVQPDEAAVECTPLYYAAMKNDEEVVEILLDHGANPLSGYNRSNNYTPWFAVCRERNYTMFTRFFDEIELIHQKNPDQDCFHGFDWKLEGLCLTLEQRWEKASHFLIQWGANDRSWISRQRLGGPSHGGGSSSTLQIAVQCSGVTVIKALLNRSLQGASKSAELPNSALPFESGEHRAYMNYLDDYRCSAIHYLMRRDCSTLEECESIMKLLLQHDADPSAVSDEGITALHVAAAIGSTHMVRKLMDEGLSLEARTVRGATAIHVAAGGTHRSPQVIRYLTAKGLDPLRRDFDGRSALHWAAAACNVTSLEALLQQSQGETELDLEYTEGATIPGHAESSLSQRCGKIEYVNLTDRKGESLLHIVGRKINRDGWTYDFKDRHIILEIWDTVRLLVDHGAKLESLADGKTPLLSIMSDEYNEGGQFRVIVAYEFLMQGANPESRDSYGQSALHYAARFQYPVVMEYLIRAGVDIEAKDHNLRTPLHLASRYGSPRMVKALLLHGADCKVRDSTGSSPLHFWAAKPQFERVAEMLIKRGADVQAVNNAGATTLHVVARTGNLSRIRFLLRLGAQPEIVDGTGKTALHCLTESGSITITDRVNLI